MLEIDVVLDENFDETTSKFGVVQSVKVRLEHSLFTASKWEAVWEEPFLGKKDKTQEQTASYLRMMILNEDLPPEVFVKLVENHMPEINEYIGAKMSATKLAVDKKQSREVITAELIYYWMVTMNIPVQFEHWHLNRLVTFVRVIQLKNTKQKPMTPQERSKLNRQRLEQGNTKG